MKPHYLSLLVLFCLINLITYSLHGQNCDSPTTAGGDYLHANNVRAFYMASGSSFFDGNDAAFSVDDPLDPLSHSIATIFAHGLWMGGYDSENNLAVSAAQYGLSSGNHDYYPGPLNEEGSVDNTTCGNFDQVWSVYRYQIEAHQADFADNGVVDNPIAIIMGWPALGNAQFEAINGFTLPDASQGFAAFADLNGNGVYEPLAGEYPRISQTELIPDQIIWTVFNTSGNFPSESGSENHLVIEVQLTAWAFSCADNPILNNSTFASYKIINKSTESIQGFRAALWADFDLGCYTDDYIGSAPALNTFFAYNQDNDDNYPCSGGVYGAGTNPPVQAISFLNQTLDNFNYYSNNSGQPSGPGGPSTAIEYYNFMNGLFRDGTPITTGGSGYNPGSTDIVNHAFPGDPNDLDAWSEITANVPPADRRGLGSTRVDELNPGGVYTLDVAYSYHRLTGSDHLDNVTNMYEAVTDLQVYYDMDFADFCSQNSICEEDCIWAGDLNADGIANHEDLIAYGFKNVSSGPERSGPYNWSPQAGDSWGATQVINGNDKKHLDANGDGRASFFDFDKTIQHYNRIRPGYIPVFDYPEGDDVVFFRLGNGGATTGLTLGESFFAEIDLVSDISDLRALAFTLEYDESYFDRVTILSNNSLEYENFTSRPAETGVEEIDFSIHVENVSIYLEPGHLLRLQMVIESEFPEPPVSDETLVRLRNLKGYLSDGTEVDLGARDVVIQIDGIVNSEEPAWGQNISIFPNPADSRLNIQTTDVVVDRVQLFDSQSRMLSTPTLNDGQLDLTHLPQGLYYLRLFSEGAFVTRKFVKM